MFEDYVETSFCQNHFLPIPAGDRSSVTGRLEICGTIAGAIAA
jgi:hypothetical protein